MKLFTTFLPQLLFSSAIFTGIIIHPFTNSSVYANDSEKTQTKIPEAVRNVGVRVEIHGVVNGEKKIQNGSGVIISRNGNQYTVLTADHLLFSTIVSSGDRPYVYDPEYKDKYQGKLFIVVNNRPYEVTPENIYRLRDDRRIGLDLALIRFTSRGDENYPVAKLALTAGIFDPVNVYGWPNPVNSNPQPNEYEDAYLTSTIYSLDYPPADYSGRSIVRGYTMSYDSDLNLGGLSGGPVFDENQEFVIGIHGSGKDIRSEIPTISNIFIQDKSLINRAAATPINLFLDQLPKGLKYNRKSLFSNINPEWLIGMNKDQPSAQQNDSNDEIKIRQQYRDAVMLMRVKKFSDAIQLLEDVVKRPNYAVAHLALGDAYYQNAASGNIKEQENAKEKAFEQYNKAENILKRDKEKYGNQINTDIILRRVAILAQMKKYGMAKTELKKLEELAKNRGSLPLTVTYYINQALLDQNDKDKSKAKTNLENARKKVQDKVKENVKNLEKAKAKDRSEESKKFLYLDRSKNAFYLLAIGKEYYKAYYLGDEGKKTALEIFDEAIGIDPNDVSTYLAISTFLRSQNKDKSAALEYFERLERQNSENQGILPMIMEIYENDFKSPEQAIKIATQLVDQDPENPENHFELGQLLEKDEQKEKAVQYFQKALELFTKRKNPYGILSVNKKLCSLSPEDNRESCLATSLSPTKKPSTTNQLPQTITTTPVTPDSTFSCDPKTSKLTLRTTNDKQHILINWQSTAFTPSGYNPQIRCQHVSARLQKFQKESRLNPENITSSVRTYKIKKDGRSIPYSLNVLCLAKSSSDAAAKKCAEDGLIITLERSEKPEQILKQFREALSEEFAGEPLTKGVDKQKYEPTSENQK